MEWYTEPGIKRQVSISRYTKADGLTVNYQLEKILLKGAVFPKVDNFYYHPISHLIFLLL